jgi:hypothetical protein
MQHGDERRAQFQPTEARPSNPVAVACELAVPVGAGIVVEEVADGDPPRSGWDVT